MPGFPTLLPIVIPLQIALLDLPQLPVSALNRSVGELVITTIQADLALRHDPGGVRKIFPVR